MFQVSGQGPYFGQATWFARFHPEKLPSAIDRYVNEIDRVTGVLNTALQGKDWLVGHKCTYADLSFITWANVAKGLLAQLGKLDILEKYPDYLRWMKEMEERPVVKEANEKIAAGRKAHGLQ
jgi:glutathione S-transferase